VSAKIFCATFIFLFFLQKNQAQTSTENFHPPHTQPVVKAAKTTAKTAPDGLLDEVNWQAALLIADFFRMKPKQGGNYDFLTTVRLLFNDETKDNDWDALWFVKTKILENG